LAKALVSVLVVDDSEPFRRFVASTLVQKPELQIIGEISDGLDAVYRAGETQPNLILLDIGLPTLNGIEAALRIRELSPTSKILFFSENRSGDVVEEALRTGAVGYVAKSDATRELLAAVETVLQGMQFVSSCLLAHQIDGDQLLARKHPWGRSLAPLPRHKGKGEILGHHEVVFYSDDRHLLDRVSQFIGAALSSGNTAILVATGSHREGLMQGLQAYGVDMAAAIEQGRYIALDAADMVLTFMVDGMLEPDRFLQSFGQLILQAANAARGDHPRVAVFGEGADLLWKQGNAEAAIQDEKLCNQLCERYDVDILCAYSRDNVEGVLDEKVSHICAEHSAVYRA
jgi:DNA-binding NarL/FixJ family response regulator